MDDEVNSKTATFANGCFWCTEAVFQRLKGVVKVTSGYAGGTVANPSYQEVCTGNTGHAECLRITYNPNEISYSDLLDVFWATHDPTTLNRQGNDVGTQYRSVIFYENEEQRKEASDSKAVLEKSGTHSDPIVTDIQPLQDFYPAEKEHYDYYNRNPEQAYCYYVARPKVEKLKKLFADKVRE